MAQRLEDPVETLVLALHQQLQPGQRSALGLQAAPARRRRGPLLGMAQQAPLHLGLALGQDTPALDHARHAHLELLAPRLQAHPALLERLPGLEGLLQVGQRPGQLRLFGGDIGQPLLGRDDRDAGVVELARDAPLLLGGALHGRPGPSRRPTAWRSLARSAAVRASRHRPRTMRLSVSWARASSAAAAASSARRRASSTEAAVTTLVAERTRHPVAAKRSPSGVTTTRSSRASERSIASSQPSTRTARPTRVSSTDSATDPPWRTRTWRRTGSALLPGGSSPVRHRGRRCRGVRMAPVTPLRAGWPAPPGRSAVRRPPRRRRRPRWPPRRRLPIPRRSPPGRPANRRRRRRRGSSSRPPAPCRSASARSSASARAAVRWRASSASSADTWAVSACAPPLRAPRCAPPARPPARRSPARARPPVWPAGRRAPAAPAVRSSSVTTRPASASMSSCSRTAARAAESSAGPDPGDGLIGRVVAQHRGPALPQRGASSSSRPAPPAARRVRAPRRASSSASAATSSLASRAASASRVETTSTSAAASSAATTPRPRSRSTPVSPRARSTRPCTRPSALARSSSRRDDSSAVVEVASASSRSSASCSSASSSRHTARCWAAAARRAAQLGLLGAGEIPPHRQQLGGHAVVRAGRRRLPLQRSDLAPHLAHQVAQALEVLGRAGQPALGPLPPAPVLQHAGCLLNDGPPVLGPGVQHGVELALADDHVLLAPHARVAQQLLDVEQPAGRPVDGVLAVARAEERPGDGDLGQVDGQLARRVVDGERDLGPAQLRARGRPGENDVLHFRRAQRAGALGAEHPGHGVDHVGLPAPVGAHDHGDPGLEFEHRRVGEGLETLHAERLQEHRGDPTGALRARAAQTAGHTWQCSQKKVERPPAFTRTMVLRQRRQGSPSRS